MAFVREYSLVTDRRRIARRGKGVGACKTSAGQALKGDDLFREGGGRYGVVSSVVLLPIVIALLYSDPQFLAVAVGAQDILRGRAAGGRLRLNGEDTPL